MAADRTPIVFVHGLWLHPESWRPWLDLFASEGYDPTAPGWPGVSGTVDETRAHPERVAGYGLDAVVERYAGVIPGLPSKPVVDRALLRRPRRDATARAGARRRRRGDRPRARQGRAAPAALDRADRLDRAPPPDEPQRDRQADPRAVPLRVRQRALARGVRRPLRALDGPLHRPPAVRGVLGEPVAALSRARRGRGRGPGPLLLVAGGRDRTTPPVITRSLLRLSRKSPAVTDYEELSDRGHSLVLDSGWREVADVALTWLRAQSRRP